MITGNGSSQNLKVEILIVEDTSAYQKLLSDTLINEGYAVCSFESGELALRSIKEKLPSLILLDVKMPGTDGFEVCRQLKADKTTRDIPIIFICDLDDQESKLTGFQAGGVDYISKPFSNEEVLSRVKTHVSLLRLQQDLIGRNLQLENEIRDQSAERLAEKIKKQSEEKFRRIIESSPTGMYLYELQDEGKLIFTGSNPSGNRIIGMDHHKLIGKTIQEAFPELAKTNVPEMYCSIAKGELDSQSFEIEYHDHDVNGYFMVNVFRTEHHTIAVDFFDITERRQAEEKLNYTQLLLKSSLESPKDMIIMAIDRNYQYLYFNETHKAAMKYAYNTDVVIGMNILDCITSDEDRVNAKTNYDCALAGESHTSIQEYGDVDVSYYESNYNPIFNEKNEVIGTAVFASDITERKQSEKALKESEELFRTTLYSIGDGVITADKKGRVKLMNQVAEKLTGWTQSEASDKLLEQVFRIINEDTLLPVEIPVRKVLREGVVVGLANHTLLIAKDDTQKPIADSGAPIRNEKGEIVGVVLAFRDQSEERRSQKILEESERRFKLLYENAPLSYQSLDTQARLIDVNPAWLATLGYNREEVIGRFFGDFMTPESAELIKARFANFVSVGEIHNYEFEMVRKDGTHFIVSYDGKIGYDEFGHFKQTHCIFTDITSRIQADEAIRNERQLLRTLIDNLPVTIYVKDNEGRKIVANKADLEIVGKETEAEVLGKTDLETFDSEIGQRGYDDDMKVIHTGVAVINREEAFQDKNGTKRWLLTSKIPLHDQRGKAIGLVGIGRDITEQKMANETIQKLSKSIEQSPSTIIITDVLGNIEYTNPKFSEITGYTQEEVIGKNPRMLKSGEMPAEAYKLLWDTISSGDVWRGEFHNRRKNGESYWEWATMTSIKNEHGIITNYIAIKEDISLRKAMEVDLIAAKEKAEENDRLKSAFLANMSHEVRTPLNSIIGFSELLLDADFEMDQKVEFIHHIIKNGNSLLTIISDIMDISKMESGQITIRKNHIHVSTFLTEIKQQYSSIFKGKNLEFRLLVPENAYELIILADTERLHQVFNNLIGNALKFTMNGYVQIEYQAKEGMVHFRVTDTGIGIPAEFHDKIFDRFRQVEDSTTRKYGGNGLGLAITKNLIELMDGKIWLESEPGMGTSFYFTLPKLK